MTAADLRRQHRLLLANGLAQSQALGRAGGAEPHRHFPGHRPSTTFVLERLTPRSLGALLALYEHRVFTSGALWGIDNVDQWGLELGKALSGALLARLDEGAALRRALRAGARRLDRRLLRRLGE